MYCDGAVLSVRLETLVHLDVPAAVVVHRCSSLGRFLLFVLSVLLHQLCSTQVVDDAGAK